MNRFIVLSKGHRYYRGAREEVDVSVSYNADLDKVFGHGYALKCARITARDTAGTLVQNDNGRIEEIRLK